MRYWNWKTELNLEFFACFHTGQMQLGSRFNKNFRWDHLHIKLWKRTSTTFKKDWTILQQKGILYKSVSSVFLEIFADFWCISLCMEITCVIIILRLKKSNNNQQLKEHINIFCIYSEPKRFKMTVVTCSCKYLKNGNKFELFIGTFFGVKSVFLNLWPKFSYGSNLK